MGDSITFGVGVNPNCAPFPTYAVDVDEFCPVGGSYAVYVARKLRRGGVAGHFMNIGVGGAHFEDVMTAQLPYLPAESTLVTLYVGTNDSRAVKDPKQTVAEVTNHYEKHFDELLAAIHAKAPKARIVLINFPNEQYLAALTRGLGNTIQMIDQDIRIEQIAHGWRTAQRSHSFRSRC
jgi:lysophospholipase L1-like esterase